MRPETAIGLLADSARLRVFSAVVLGAATPPEAARAAGTSPREAATALRRLRAGGLLEEADGRLRVPEGAFEASAREASAREASAREPQPGSPAEEFRTGDPRRDALLHHYVRDGRLTSLPGPLQRRREVLRHLALNSFEPGRRYPEPEVNEVLRDWAGRARTDHVALRRYLIELNLLDRQDSVYWLRDDIWADFHV
ncbi:DUF2087 domain-containing protein [Streptomyces sp. NPDC056503]|uniref:DUF2087 domain-containing protein n=1 Tax=Streptomyces sp. NPDC056503 TaxID=3345842 RepID=UPI003693A10B